jgi:hypothetical protein
MKSIPTTALALALAAAFPAAAQGSADLQKELEALKSRIGELEAKIKSQEAQKPQWGMTPDQARELNRVTIKTEALEDARDESGLKQMTISGYADPTYVYNSGLHNGGFNFINNRGDTGYSYDNSYFGSVVLDFTKETESGTRWRLTLSPNRGTDTVIGNGTLVQEASVSVPLGDLQTRLLAGHLPDWSGYEYQQATLNKLVTHNLLFDFTLPTSYTGAGMEITRGKWVTKWALGQVNTTRNADGDRGAAIAYRVDYSRGEFQGFGFAGVVGKAPNYRVLDDTVPGGVLTNPATGLAYSRLSTVNLLEVDAYFIRGDWTVQGQASVGRQKHAAITDDAGTMRDSSWTGLSALVAYKFTPRLEGVARADLIRNAKHGGGLFGYTVADARNGIGPDPSGDPEIGANRHALSLGVNYLWDLSTTLKFEYRRDWSNLPVFETYGGAFRKHNSLFGASVVVSF